MHHTKDKGDTGIGKVVSDLMSKGMKVAFPICEHLPFDLIAIDHEMKTSRVQVKYKKINRNAISINLRNCYSDRNGTHCKKVNKEHIDVFAIYCPCNDEVYYVSTFELTQVSTQFNLGFPSNTKRNLHKKRMASEYRNWINEQKTKNGILES